MRKLSVVSVLLILALLCTLVGCNTQNGTGDTSNNTPSSPVGTTAPNGTTAPGGATEPDGTTVPGETTVPGGTTAPDGATEPSGTEPAPVETMIVHAYVPESWGTPRLWAWEQESQQNLYDTWPGQTMTKNGDHYTIEIPLWVNAVIVNGKEGTVQTADLPIEIAREIWIVAFDTSSKVYYQQPTAAELTPPVAQYVTVYASVPADWGTPNCWAWLSAPMQNAFGAWPGEAMAMADGYYAISVPSWVNYVIINGNGGSYQTADLPVETGRDLWVVVTVDNAQVVYSRSEADALTGKG